MESNVLSETRQEALKILLDLAKSIDRRLDVEVREIPGQDRLAVTLTHGDIRVWKTKWLEVSDGPFPTWTYFVTPRTPAPEGREHVAVGESPRETVRRPSRRFAPPPPAPASLVV